MDQPYRPEDIRLLALAQAMDLDWGGRSGPQGLVTEPQLAPLANLDQLCRQFEYLIRGGHS